MQRHIRGIHRFLDILFKERKPPANSALSSLSSVSLDSSTSTTIATTKSCINEKEKDSSNKDNTNNINNTNKMVSKLLVEEEKIAKTARAIEQAKAKKVERHRKEAEKQEKLKLKRRQTNFQLLRQSKDLSQTQTTFHQRL